MKKAIKIILTSTLVISIFLILGVIISYKTITNNAVLYNTLLPKQEEKTVFYDNYGNEINAYKKYIPYSDIPENLIHAVIATEDKRFYTHDGLDFRRTFSAMLKNIKYRDFVEGGSTISQQLIKNTHLTQEKTIKRKMKEYKITKELEENYSKEEILEMYLNIVYFGNGIYGINDAIHCIFNKNIDDITLSECAILAGILKNPNKYSPLNSIENSKSRRDLVLKLMLQEEYINNSQYENAKNEEIKVRYSPTITKSYISSVVYEASKILNIEESEIYGGNYKIKTCLDINTQNKLYKIISNKNLYKENDTGIYPDGLGIIIDNKTYGIKAYFSTSKQNIYTLNRPYGSTFKPIIYGIGFKDNKICASSPVLDEKCDFSGYSPKNYLDNYLGNTTIRDAIITSSNVVAVKTYNSIGYSDMKDFSKIFNINLENDNLTNALGNTYSNNFISLMSFYTMLANYGIYSTPHFIKEIYDKDNNLIYKNFLENNAVLEKEDAYILTDILKDNAEYGTAKGLSDMGIYVASKTGTVGCKEYNSDAINISYTTNNTYLIYHGNYSNKISNNMSKYEMGGSYVTRSMREIIKLMESENSADFIKPQNIVEYDIDLRFIKDGFLKIADNNTPEEDKRKEYFKLENIDYFL